MLPHPPHLAALLALVFAVPAMVAGSGGAAVPMVLVEEFDALDPAVWQVSDGPGPGSCVGSPCFRADHAVVEGGVLRLRLDEISGAGAQVFTLERFGPGLYEVRLQAPVGGGAIFAFFPYACPPGDEIDFVELINASHELLITGWTSNACTGLGGPTAQWTVPLAFDPADGYHAYRFLWKADGLVVAVDEGKPVLLPGSLPASPLHLYLNLWKPRWIDAEITDPLEARVDWIRVAGAPFF